MMMNEDTIHKGGVSVDLPGSRTTRMNKPLMVDMLRVALRENRIIFYRRFVVSQPDYATCSDVKEEMITQLKSFCRILKENKMNPSAANTITYDGKGGGGQDDFVITIMLSILMRSVFYTKSKYQKYW